MGSFTNTFFSPLGPGACVYFMILTVISFILLVISLIADVFYLIKHRKTIKTTDITQGVIILCNMLLAYFVNRLLYSMCSKSL